MTFDSHSLERLKELGRKLPKEISQSQPKKSRNSKEKQKAKLHPVEIENNPDKLFRELMDVSTDGNVPPHLLDRLKQLESKNNQNLTNLDELKNDDSKSKTSNTSINLYTQFKQLLLEDDPH